jgi:hypothetical protein
VPSTPTSASAVVTQIARLSHIRVARVIRELSFPSIAASLPARIVLRGGSCDIPLSGVLDPSNGSDSAI